MTTQPVILREKNFTFIHILFHPIDLIKVEVESVVKGLGVFEFEFSVF